MKIVILFLLLATEVLAEPLNFVWDKVTTDTLGNVIPEPKYRFYRKLSTSDRWKIMGEREGNWFTIYFPPAGHYVYRVTAFNETGESGPSNEVRVFGDICSKEE